MRTDPASRARLLEVAEPLEPRAVHLVDALLEQPDRRLRTFVVEEGDRLLGGLVLSRLCRDRWLAFPLLLAAAAAEPLGAALERSPAWLLLGLPQDTDPLLPHVTRVVRTMDLELAAVDLAELQDQGTRPDRRTRFADASDVGGLVELYAAFELDYLPTMRRLRRDLERDVDRSRVVVLEADGQIVGAYRIEAGTRRTLFWSHLTVAPTHRGRKLGDELGLRGMSHTADRGMVFSTARHPTNPTLPTAPADAGAPDVLRQIRLGSRHPLLHRMALLGQRLEGPRGRRSTVVVDDRRWERGRNARHGRDKYEVFEQQRAAEVDGTREDG